MSKRFQYYSEEWLTAANNRAREAVEGNDKRRKLGRPLDPSSARPRHGEGTRPPLSPYKYKGYRSKLEFNWAKYLDGLIALGAVDTFYYEPFNIRLPGKKNFYNPDFLVIAFEGITFYEVKGRNKSDDRSLVKMKTAAGIHQWAKFVLVKYLNGQWDERHII